MSVAELVLLNGVVSFISSLAAFVVWHHFDLANRWDYPNRRRR